MLQGWRTAFSDLQQDRKKLLVKLNAFTSSQLEFQPAPSAWSLLQVVEHLMLVERAMIKDARERLSQPLQTVTSHENIMSFVVLCVLNSGMKIKTPAGSRNVTPQQKTSLDSLTYQWSTTRDDLEHLLEELSPRQHASAIFRHPVSGGMTPGQGLKFIRAHIRHHHAQIERLIQLSSRVPALTGVA